MEYSKQVFKRVWGKPYLVACVACACAAAVPLVVAVIWNMTHEDTLPKIAAYPLGALAFIMVFLGIPISLSAYVAKERRCRNHTLGISDGILKVSLSIQHGWTASFAGFVHERKEYVVYSVRDYSETPREFIVNGEIGCMHYYKNQQKPEVMVDQLKIPKVFDGEDQLRDYLKQAKGGV